MKSGRRYVLGIDFGTDSIRAMIVDATDGNQVGTGEAAYRSWKEARFCDARRNQFRQHPSDHIEAMTEAVASALARAGGGIADRIEGLTVDTTCSSPCFVDATCTPLCFLPGFAEDPDAMFILWKDHTSIRQAGRINELARRWSGGDFTAYEGGVYSSEWFWAKALRVVEENPRVAEQASTIVEHSDWLPALLTGVKDFRKIIRNRGSAGAKAMWHASWGGYPPADFLATLHPRLAEFRKDLPAETFTPDTPIGTLCPEWAARLGLKESTIVSAGQMDAHSGAVGGGIQEGTMVKVMGTSTCDLLIGPRSAGKELLVKGICGQVDGSVLPGWIGYEAGQSAYGDIFAWFRGIMAWPLKAIPGLSAKADAEDAILPAIEAAASLIEPEESGLVALDWLNGRRSPFGNQSLKGAIAGITLGTDAPMIYRALVEAAVFGSRAINERLLEDGIPIRRIVAVGGVARKSPLVMQISADVFGMEIAVSAADQSCALGAAMYASVACGIHPDMDAAQKAMDIGAEKTYRPDPARKAVYDLLYGKYLDFGSSIESPFNTKR